MCETSLFNNTLFKKNRKAQKFIKWTLNFPRGIVIKIHSYLNINDFEKIAANSGTVDILPRWKNNVNTFLKIFLKNLLNFFYCARMGLNKGRNSFMSIVKKAKKIVKSSKLLDMDILTISNFLCNEAIRRHVIDFKSKKVPFRFIEFFHSELSKIEAVANDLNLQKFFSETKNENQDVLGFVYFLTFPDIIKTIKTLPNKEYFFVLFSKKPPLSMKFRSKENKTLEKSLNTLVEAIEHFNESEKGDKIQNAFASWKAENPFVFKAFTDNPESIKAQQESEAQAQTFRRKLKEGDFELTGEKITIPHDEFSKVHKLFIPSLPLPSEYPKGDKSRVHSGYHANFFVKPSKTIEFINEFRIVSVVYTKSFFELRTEINKPEQEKRWSDFF